MSTKGKRNMKRSMRCLCFLPLLLYEVKSSYLRDRSNAATNHNDAVSKPHRYGRTRRGLDNGSTSADVSQSSVRRILPQDRDPYEYHDCSPNVVEFESVVFIEFNSDLSNLTDSERQSLEQSFLSTYNSLNERHCDLPYHRSILDVTLEWPPRRRLKKTTEMKKDSLTIYVDSFNASDPYAIPGTNHSTEASQTVDLDGDFTLEEPEKQYVDIARFYVNVECRNCPTNTSLFSPSEILPSPIHSSVASIAQGRATDAVLESCACLTDKKIDTPFRAPTAAEFQVQFNKTVGYLHIQGVLQDLDEVEDLVEVDVVDCSSNKKKFSSNIVANLTGSVELLTMEERRALEQGFLETYNSLTFSRCDRYFRQILEVKLISGQDRRSLLEVVYPDDDEIEYLSFNSSSAFNSSNSSIRTNATSVPNKARSTPAVYRVLGECRDCLVTPSGSFDLFDDGFRRHLTQSWLVPPLPSHYGRNLLEEPGDVCLCPANAEPTDPKAPSDKEFQAEYNHKVEKLQREGVVFNVQTVDDVANDEDVCELELLEDTNYYIVTFEDEPKREWVEKKLVEAFRDAYRVFDREICGPLLSDVEVVEIDDSSLEVLFEVVSLQTYNGSIFYDLEEEDLFVLTFNEKLEDERIEAVAVSIQLQDSPSAAPSSMPSLSVAPTTAPTAAPIVAPIAAPTFTTTNTSLPGYETPQGSPGGTNTQGTGPPTTGTPAPTPISSTIARTTLPPTPGSPQGYSPIPAAAPTIGANTPTQPPALPKFAIPAADDVPADMNNVAPLGPPGTPTVASTTTKPTVAPTMPPTTEFDKAVNEVDKAIGDIIDDVGDAIGKILGSSGFPVLSNIPDFLDEVARSLERILESDINLSGAQGLLSHVAERIDELSRIPWISQPTDTYAHIQSTIAGVLTAFSPGAPAPSPSDNTPDVSTPRPTTDFDKKVADVEATVAGIVQEVGATLEQIVGHTIDVIDGIPQFLDSVGVVLDDIASQPSLPEIPELPELLEHVSDKVDEIAELPFIPDLPDAAEKIQKTISGLLGLLRPVASTESQTDSPTQSPISIPIEATFPPSTSSPTALATGPLSPKDNGRSPSPSVMATLPPSRFPTTKPTVQATSAPSVTPSSLPTRPPPASPQPSTAPSLPPTLEMTNAPNCGKRAKGKGSKEDECSDGKNGRQSDDNEEEDESSSWLENAWNSIWGGREERPTEHSTSTPTRSPSMPPTVTTDEPTLGGTELPTRKPTVVPTSEVTQEPTLLPTPVPTEATAEAATNEPSLLPTLLPTEVPTASPTTPPTSLPTEQPSTEPTLLPSESPTEEPTELPTLAPTLFPKVSPTKEATEARGSAPTLLPTDSPTK